jgi:hypothetical protein
MKKIIVGLAVLLNVLTVNANAKVPVSDKVLQSFQKEFARATNVNWVSWSEKNIFQATFTYDNARVEAYFDEDGDLLSTARFITESQLPLMVMKVLSTDYARYTVRRVVEYTENKEVYYLVTVFNEKGSMSLKFYSNGDVQRVKQVKNKN